MKHKQKKDQAEQPVTYADQYIYGENYSDKYDYLRNKGKKDPEKKAAALKNLKRAGVLLGCIAVFCAGYFLMGVIMERNAIPEAISGEPPSAQTPGGELPDVNEVNLTLNAKYISSDYLDGGAMIDAVIREATDSGYNAVIFDLKRENGTLAYPSGLTAAATYSAVASPGVNVRESVQMLLENNIIPLARIYCFPDNTAAAADTGIAVTTANGAVWKDAGGNSWLNPYSDYAKEYLASVVLEVQELGITNIILDGLTFPGQLTGAVFSGAPEGQTPDSALTAQIINALRGQLSGKTRLLAAADFNVANETELNAAIEQYLALEQKDGVVPVLTMSIAPQAAADALDNAKINSYIFIISEPETEATTEMESPE